MIHALLLATLKSPNQGDYGGLAGRFQWEKQVVNIELWWENLMVRDYFEWKLIIKSILRESIYISLSIFLNTKQ
jgi:hypothetical protein